MPDLSMEAIRQWIETHGVSAGIDHDQLFRENESPLRVQQAFTELGNALEAAQERDQPALQTALTDGSGRDGLRRVLAQLGPGRTVRIFHWLSDLGSSNADAVLNAIFANLNDANVLAIREALQLLHRRELLQRLFGEDRVKGLLAACRMAEKEAA